MQSNSHVDSSRHLLRPCQKRDLAKRSWDWTETNCYSIGPVQRLEGADLGKHRVHEASDASTIHATVFLLYDLSNIFQAQYLNFGLEVNASPSPLLATSTTSAGYVSYILIS